MDDVMNQRTPAIPAPSFWAKWTGLRQTHTWQIGYLVAIGCVVLATLIRWLLTPVLGNQFPFATLFFAVMAAAWFGGLGPGLAATLVGAGAAFFFLLQPATPAIPGMEHYGGMILYVSVGTGIALLGGGMRAAEILARGKATEASKRQQELQTTLTSIGDGVVVTDAKERVILLNPVAETLTGWSNVEANGRSLHEVFRIVNESTRTPVENPADKVVRDGRIVGLANHTILIAKDGTERAISDSAAPIRGPDGDIEGIILVFRDVSEKRKAERALEASEHALREADKRKDEFLAMLAHELRNPLAPIRNALQILRLSASAPEHAPLHAMLDRQVNHMVRLVDDLLEVSRITSGRIELRTEPMSLADVIQSAVETSKPALDAAGQRLAVQLPPEPVTLSADATRLAQVFANLLNNASKYTPSDGTIEVTARREDGQAIVAVRDTGVGIPPEMLHKVFDLFTQVDGSLGRSKGGLGIGLTLVKRLVEMHGGTVEARSDGPGKGSEFVVRLPV
jgi:PAS domain S-box-containing protein